MTSHLPDRFFAAYADLPPHIRQRLINNVAIQCCYDRLDDPKVRRRESRAESMPTAAGIAKALETELAACLSDPPGTALHDIVGRVGDAPLEQNKSRHSTAGLQAMDYFTRDTLGLPVNKKPGYILPLLINDLETNLLLQHRRRCHEQGRSGSPDGFADNRTIRRQAERYVKDYLPAVQAVITDQLDRFPTTPCPNR